MPRNNRRLTPPAIDFRNPDQGMSDHFAQIGQMLRQREMMFEFENSPEIRRRLYEARRVREEEERERKWLEEYRRQDRERQHRNAELFRREREQRLLNQQNALNRRDAENELRKLQADIQYERDYNLWLSDVERNPQLYSFPVRRIAELARNAQNASGFSSIYHFGEDWAARRYFDMANAIGSMVTSSIDTNGLSIQGQISLNEIRKLAANAYDEYLNTQERLQQLDNSISNVENNLSNNSYDLDQYNRDIAERNQLRTRVSSPEITGLVDAYKLFFVLDRKNWGLKFFSGLMDAIDEWATYDRFKPQLREKKHQELLLEYDRIINSAAFSANEENVHNVERAFLNMVINKADADNAELQQEYIDNRTHLRESEEYWNVAKGFKMNTQAHANDAILNPYYWLYELPPMIGSSMSSPSQAAATAIKGVTTVAGLALAPFSEGASLNLLWVGELAATPFDWKGAEDENYGESGEKRIDNIIRLLQDPSVTRDVEDQDKTTYDVVMEELKARSEAVWRAKGWKEEWIREHLYGEDGDKNAIQDYISGITSNVKINTDPQNRENESNLLLFGEFMNPAFLDALLFSTQGLLAQFDANMMRTAGEMPFLKAMAFIPTKWLKVGGRALDRTTANLREKVVQRIEKSASGRITARAAEVGEEVAEHGAERAVRTKYSNGFNRQQRTFRESVQHGYEAGGTVGDMTGFGFAGHVVGGIVGGAAEGAVHTIRSGVNIVAPRLAGLLDGFEERVMMKYQGILDKLTPDKVWQLTLLKYGIKSAKRNIAIGMSEAAEEATLYLNSKDDFAGKYGWAGMSLGDWITNDLHQGGRVLDAYLSLVGLGNSPLLDDEEYWLNLKGGFMLGGLPMANPSGIVQTAGHTVRGYKEYKSHGAVISSGVMNREYDNINRAATAEFVRQAVQNRELHVISAIDKMERADSRRQNPFFTLLDYDTRRQEAQIVMSMAKDKTIRKMLEAKGIHYGTEQYATAISDLYTLLTQLDDNSDQTRRVNQGLNSVYNSRAFQTAVQSIIDDISLNSVGDRQEIDAEIKKAGDTAAIQEIDAIRQELNLEPGSKKYAREINKPEYKQRIADARTQAEERTRAEIQEHFRNTIIAKTRLANKLKGLLEMKARHNTIDDFYTFLKDKFNLSPKRPDAKTIRDNIDQQIKDTKELLARVTAETTDEFNANSTDAQALEYLELIQDIVHTGGNIESYYNATEAQQYEAALAMLSADRAVTQSYYDQFTYGLIKNNGKWEYNPAEFKARKDRQKKAQQLIREGRMEELRQFTETPVKLLQSTEEELKQNDYSRRIDAIMEANQRNQALKWAINEVANGDAVNKLMMTLQDERQKAETKQEKNELKEQTIRQEAARDPFDNYSSVAESTTQQPQQETAQPQQVETPVTNTTVKQKPVRNAQEKYKRGKEKVKNFFDRQRKQYDRFSKGSLKSGVPFQDQIVKGAFMLAENASIATLKFSEFVEQMMDILPNVSLKDALPSIKAGYNKRRVFYLMNNPSILDNMSTADEVMNYGKDNTNNGTFTPPPALKPLHIRMQEQFDYDASKILQLLSSHFDIIVNNNGVYTIYHNTDSIAFSSYKDTDYGVQNIAKYLKEANTSDESFRAAIKAKTGTIPNFPVEEYVKIRDTEGIEEAIARKYLTWVPNQFIESGIKVRDAAIAILLGKDSDLDETQYPSNFGLFKQDVLKLKDSLNDRGLTILNTKQYIYGIDKNGNKVATQADIIAADDKGNVYAIDVRSGYKSIRERWDTAISKRVGYTIEEQVTKQLKTIEEVINTKFSVPVKGLYVLPVIYNAYDENGIRVEKDDDGKMLIPVKTVADRHYSTDVEQVKNDAQKLVDEINLLIREYNNYLLEALKYTNKYQSIPEITVSEHSTRQDYIDYMERLHSQYDDLNSRIDDMKNIIQDNIDRENNIWLENAEQNVSGEPSVELSVHLARLEECCRDLDIVLQYIPQVKATTQRERENVKVLYQSIFDAQKALDDVLQHPMGSLVNVQDEAELIAHAMEVLTQNKENFGAMSMFMRRWWAENFVVGKGTTTLQGVQNINEQAAAFVNTIKTWVDTLRNHVLTDLDNHEALQEWYSSILNNYFSKLLDNATKFAEQQDPAFKTAMEKVVLKGKQLIKDFNEGWGTNPDEEFPGPPADEVERINRMPVKWQDLYGTTTAHSPAFDAMANSIIYYVMSTSSNFTRGYKTQMSPVDNPEDKSTRFTLFKNKQGDVQLRINWYDGKQWKYVELPFEINIANYKNASAEDIQRFTEVNRANKKFTKKVKKMLDYIEKHPEYKLTFSVKTNKGSINYGQPGEHHNVSEFLFKRDGNEHDLYTVTLSQQDRIGVGVFIKDQVSGKVFYDVRAGENLRTRIGGFDDTYSKQHLNTLNGAIVYFYDNGDGNYIGVPLQTLQIGSQSAMQLVDLMHRYITGERIYNGYDIMSLLKQRLYIYDPTRSLSGYNNRNNMITINQNGDIVIGEDTFNIFSNKLGLIARIAAMNNSTSAEILNQNIASSNDQVLQSARQRFANDPSLNSIVLPNGFVLSKEDFIHRNANGTQGSTWLGYLLRNGILGTRATSRGYKQVNIDDLALVSKDSPVQIDNTTSVEERKESRRRRMSSLDAIDDPFAKAKGGLTMTAEEDVDVNRGSEEQEDFVHAVREYFKNVFGTDADLLFEDTVNGYISTASRNQRVIGLTTAEMVKLSKYAPYSVMYHEAFHKLLELVLPDKTRQSFYDIYRSKNGNDLTERQVAEGLADLFVDYMSKRILPKNAKWYNKIFKWFKITGYALNMCWNYGISNTRKMYTVYQNMNAGKYAGIEISKKAAERFEREFGGELYYKVNGTEFQHIADSGQLQSMVRALSYYILESYGIDRIDPDIQFTIDEFTPNQIDPDVLADLTAEGVPESELTAIDLAFREILKKGEKVPVIGKNGKNKGKTIGYKQSYPNFKAIRKNVSDYIETILGSYSGKIQDESDESVQDDGENRDIQNMNIDRYDRASYEFSKLDGVNRKVKLFFATIPYCTFDEDGRITIDYSKNEFNCPTFAPIEEVYNVIVNDLHTVQDIDELDAALRKLAQFSPMHRMVYSKYHRLISGIYTQDEQGNTVVDYDKEAFAIQILNAIRSQKIDFVIALSNTLDGDNGKEVRIATSSLERDSRQFPKQWTQFLLAGQVSVFLINRDKDGNFIFRKGMGGEDGTDIFSRTAAFITDLRQALSQANDEFTLDGKNYHKDSLENVAKIKSELISRLHQIGIIFSREALDHMLLTEYGDMGTNGMLSWLTHTGPTAINTFITALNSFVRQDGTINKQVVEKGYSDLGFVRDLAKWQGAYNRIHTQQMALGLNGKRLYSISQNSSISHIINMLNTQDLGNETVRTLMNFGYNLTGEDFPIGSIILKAIKQRKDQHLTAHTYIGFKTDNRGDEGSEYTEEATIEDYIAKLTMLQQGYMIFPTLADKGTWMIMDGVQIPGMTFTTTKDEHGKDVTIVNNAPKIEFINGKPYIIPSDAILSLMLEYAQTERLAIQQCMEDLGYDNIPGYEKQGRKPLSKSALIKNYHTNNGKVEPNGTRFLSLTKIVCKEIVDGKVKLVTYNLNDPRESSTDLLKLANEKFFNKSIEEQKEIMALTLGIQAQHEVDVAINLGIVEHQKLEGKWKNKLGVEINANAQGLMNLSTKHLNESQIQALTTEILRSIPHKDYGSWLAIPQETADQLAEKQFKYQVARSLAIASLLADATYKSIICSQEVQRCFSGHPAEFKVSYSKDGIKDSAFDIQKRIGGMISTGDDNVLNLPGIPSTYTCAECIDYEVSSNSDVASRLDEMFLLGEVREAFSNNMILLNPDVSNIKFSVRPKDIYDYAYSHSVEELEKATPDELKKFILKAKNNAAKFAESYKSGINVADGASYITDTMCENMLRMRGAYNGEVKKAFDILRGKDKYTWTQQRDAYKTVYDAVNIVTTKYTAYGFRDHTVNGKSVSDVAVAYYNKFALFPLFPCIATGKMAGIYDKMLKEGVDMLLMTSAVKVGSQGAVEFNGETIDAPFNKYTLSYAYLRRQLNTDPEEGDKITMGTQMVKIGLQNLRLGRTYVHARTGNDISGQELLDSFMDSIKALAQNGIHELQDMFLNTETGEVDPEKLSEYLKSQLSTRNANKAVIEAIQVTTDPVTGQKKLVCPLAATPDASWIESILISTINKRIIDIVTPGSSFVQRSVFAIEGSSGEGSIQSDANMAPTINDGKKLQMLNEDGSMDAVISMDYFDDILFKGKMKNMSFEEKRKWLMDNNIIGPNATANTIGYRIPTQAQSSIHALRFVDVVAAVKSTIILPEEFTKITGSDFDIDHLYLASYNYNVITSEDETLRVTSEFDLYEDDGKYMSQYHLNNIIDCLITLLKDSENSINSLYKSIDNDTELITSIAYQVEETGSTKGDPYNFGTLHEQVVRKNDYITGKTGIGPFALNVTNLVLTQLYGVRFRKSKFAENTGIWRLDHIVDVDGNAISSWLSAFINAHVDIVKDPYISRLNVNPYTYNMLNLLIRSGFGDVSVWFLAQPIIRGMANASQQAKSQYSRDPQKAKSTFAAQELAVEQVVALYLSEAERSVDVINRYTHSKDKRDIDVRINTVNWIKDHKDVLAEIAKNPEAEEVTVNNVKYKVSDVQKTVFYAWKTLEKYSIGLGDLVQHTKIDTRKHGKTLIAIQQYLDAYNKLFNDPDPDKSIWDMQSLNNLAQKSWIDMKTREAIAAPTRILNQQTFAANPQFIAALISFGNTLSTTGGVLNTDTLLFLSRCMITAIKSKYIVKYAREKLGKTDADIAALFTGPRSMNHRLVMLKNAIETNPKYTRLRGNHFINQIYSELEENGTVVRGKLVEKPGFITVLDNVDDSRVNSDLLIDGWEDLLNDEDTFVRKFARDMIVYSFLTSGEFKGWNKLFKFVPPAWIRGEIDTDFQSFADFIQQALTMSASDYNGMLDEIVSNNFMDYRLARRVPQKNPEDKSDNFIDVTSIIKVGRSVDEDQMNSVEKYITIKEDTYAGKNVAGYSLFKLQGFLPSQKGWHPVYARMKKKGYHGKTGRDVYEYGWTFGYPENENEAFAEFDQTVALQRVAQYLSTEHVGYDESSARAITDVYLGRIEPEDAIPSNNDEQEDELPLSSVQTTSHKNLEVDRRIKDILNVLGGQNDEIAVDQVRDAIDILNKGIDFDQALSTVNPIFTEEEINLIKSTGKKLFVKSVSRQTDPAFFAPEIIKFLEENAKKPFTDPTRVNVIELWSKHDGEPIQKILLACRKYKVAPMVQFSITTLGDTELEKGVLKYQDLIPLIEKLILNGDLDPRTTAIRIDPILVGRTSMEDIRNVVNMCKNLGIKKFITSLVLSYGYTVGTSDDRKVVSGITEATTREGNPYDWEKYYGTVTKEDFIASSNFVKQYREQNPTATWKEIMAAGVQNGIRVVTRSSIGKIHFIPKQQYIDEIGNILLEINQDPTIKVETCSFFVKGLNYSACLDPLIIERLTGVDVTRPDGTYDRDTSRPECMCYGVHGDMFRKNEKECYSSCAYCYAAHSGDKKFKYYDNNGNIIDRPISRVQMRINSNINDNLPGPETKINIYAGSGENVELSNFAERPFVFEFLGENVQLRSVEHGFLLSKLYEMYDEMDEDKFESLKNQILNGSASNARSIGKSGFKLSRTARLNWDENSSTIMHDLIKASFEQNLEALQKLLATGNATLTHTQDGSKWKTEFPRILMEVREELRNELLNSQSLDPAIREALNSNEHEQC